MYKMKGHFISASIIVPTRNRCKNLTKLVENIRKQNYPKDKFEMIIVDNGSTDSTRKVVDELNSSNEKKIKYIYEPNPGYHNAVNRGALEANNEIIVLIDDDTFFEGNYLNILLGAYQDRQVSCAGGKIIGHWEGGVKPDWVENHEGGSGLDLGTKKRFLFWPESIYGANFSVRRDLFYKVGGFNPSRIYGGDGETGFCKKIYDIGGKIMWVPEAVVWHVVSARTITHSWMKRRAFQQGKCNSYDAYRSTHCVKISSIVKFFIRAAICQLRSYKLMLSGKNYRSSQWAAANNFSRFLYDIRLFFDKKFRAWVLNDDHLTGLIEKIKTLSTK